MACSPQMKMFLLKYLLLLCVSCCMCQKDCTGVDCPVLENCIEEVLHSEECCATCEQTGCTCQGYQYYDCVHAGFKNGKVPEGESYFVDFGSTECSCPEGGGRISCHFIPCPEIPANCIAVSEPVDGCSQCERMGCVHGAQKYEAGHSFHMETCQVCHCPNEGGNLMCYPVPDCDPQKVQKPMLATTTEDSTAERQYSDPIQRILNHQGDKNHFIKTFSESYGENLPPFKLSPSHIDEDEDYDYPETSEPSLHGLASPTEPGVISVSYSENFTHRSTIRRGDKQELRERVAVHEVSAKRPQLPKAQETAKDNTGRRQISIHEDNLNTPKIASHGLTTHTERLPIPRNTTKSGRSDISKGNPNKTRVAHHEDTIKTKKNDLHKEVTKSKYSHGHVDTSNTLTTTDALQTIAQTTPQLWEETTASLKPTEGRSVTESQISSHTTKLVERDSRVEEKDRKVTLKSATGFDREHTTLSGGEIPLSNASHVKESVSLTVGQQVTTSRERDNKLERKHEHHTFPTVRFSPTSQPPLRVKADEGHPPNKQSQSLLNFRGEEEEQGEEDGDNTLSSFPKAREAQSGPTAPALVESCCETGQRWAADGQPCNLLSGSTHSVCNVVQRQCCIGYVRESRCVAGMSTARRGEVCEEPSGQHCTEDSQQECCSCCTLGLQLRREGRGCEAHQYLSYPCGHVFLTCCEEGDEEETGQETGSAPTLRSKNRPSPTARPKKVSDREFPKQAFFMAGTEEAANSVEELEDVDECQRYEGQLCHHTCTNTWGSYECACHPGYTLQQDGHSCALEKPDEVNRVSAQHRPITVPSPRHETTSPGSTIRNACTGNGGCMHQCSVAGGLARCSCFPGFALNADGHSCEDVDECRTGTHNCSLGAICENQDGSYRCAPLSDQCDKGFTLNPSRECVDMNECLTNTHTCLASERCVNTMGAFVCERQISCPAGYQPRNGVCEDIDECMVRTHNCSPGMQCRNTDGSFFCEPKQRCLTGFTQDPHGNCIDINECSSVSEPCSSGFNCINTVGSYTCQRKIIMCSQGYHSSPDGARCVDVDECQTGTHRCAEGQICHNLPGSYRCDCQTGYQYDAIRQVCVDVNECWRYPGRLCAQTCENTPGSYQCSCTAGFSLAFDGKNCEDMNECDNNPCSQECANIYGSYQCYCRQGFFLKEDGHACEDIDECSQSIGNLCAFECVNVPGSYQCACPPQGYSMSPNGRTCRDIDECAVGGHNCSLGQTCYNIQGGFRCLSFDCPQNYRKVSDTRCERTSCPNVVDCQNSPLRITYYQLSFQTNIVIPAQIFRIGPSPAYAGDNIIISVPRGNEEGFFSTRRLNSFTGAVYLQRQVHQPRDFLIDVEMKLLRQGTFTTFLARIYVFITASAL